MNHHTKLINCVKFFCPKQSSTEAQSKPEQQYLFSCSDDGTVRLYDFTPVSGWIPKQADESQPAARSSEEEFRVRRSQRQRGSISTSNATESAEPEQLYSIELTPDEFRPGTRNKKLDTLVMNHQGLVIAGSSSCELLVWRLNYDLVAKRVPKQDCYKFLGQFKMSKSSCVKFCEFNPKNGVFGVGETLMTGSVDGVINVWNMSVGSWRSQKENTFNLEDRSRLLVTIDEERGCRESREVKITDPDGQVQSEYILEDIRSEGSSAKEYLRSCKSVCDAVRWSVNGRFAIASVQCQLDQDSQDICRVKVWDTVEHSFIEDLSKLSGIRLPKNTFVLATHPSQEPILMTGSDNGVLALWNLHTRQLLKQFKQHGVYSVDANIMDNPLHGSWSHDGKAFIAGNCLGTITLYAHEDVKHQYEATRVQQFFQYDIERQQDNPFERITEKPTICGYNMMPYEVQPERLLIRFTDIDPHLDTLKFQRNLVIAKELGSMEERYYQDKLQTSLFDDLGANNLQQLDSIQVSAIQPPLIQDDVDMSEIQIVQQLQQARPESMPRVQRPNRPRLQRNNQRLTSSVEVADDSLTSNSNSAQSDEEDARMGGMSSSQSQSSDGSDDDLTEPPQVQQSGRLRRNNQVTREQPRQSGRPQRAARPGNLRDTETIADGESSELDVVAQPSAMHRNNRRRIQESSDSEASLSPQTEEIQRNRRNQNGRLRRQRSDSSSPEEQQRSAKKNKRRGQRNDLEFEPEPEYKRGSFYLSDHDLPSEPDDKVDYSSHMLIAASKFQSSKMEQNYELVKGATQPPQQPLNCHLCKRSDGEIVGPFQKTSSKSNQIYLHKDCIEINTYSYFSVQHKKWVNIDSMLKHLSDEAQYACYRCDGYGASVSCTTCGKNFHGYYCGGMYLISSRYEQSGKAMEGTNQQFWQCLFCKNQSNYEQAMTTLTDGKAKDPKPYHSALKKLDKSHLTTTLLPSQPKIYLPQIDDVCVYFFQGHEDFIYQYNCHFYAGQSYSLPKSQIMPFLTSIKPQLQDQPYALVKVLSITTLFPSLRSLKLIGQYGNDASEYVQTPQMIQRIELQFLEINDQKFTVDLFPNELPDFLVLYSTFEQQLQHYKKESLVGKEVTIKMKAKQMKVKVISDTPVESKFCPKSMWLTLLCQPVQFDINSRRQQSSQPDHTLRVNFWDVVFENSEQVSLHGFNEHEHAKLKNYFVAYIQKNKEYLVYFKERVQEKIAPEYRQIIPQEMWFDLLLQRLTNRYYRSARQFFADLQQIASNASAYNGEEHDVAIDAQEIVKKVRFETMKLIDCNGDRQIKERVQDAVQKLGEKQKSLMVVLNGILGDKKSPQNQVMQIEETKDEEPQLQQQPMRLTGKRTRQQQVRVDDSPELMIMEPLQQEGAPSARTLRKRQRQV